MADQHQTSDGGAEVQAAESAGSSAEKRQLRRETHAKNELIDSLERGIPIIRDRNFIGPDVTKFRELFDKIAAETRTGNNLPPINEAQRDSLRRELLIAFMEKASAPAQIPQIKPAVGRTGSAILTIDPDEYPASLSERIDIRRKWEALHDVLSATGADVRTINSRRNIGAISEVYTRDSYIIIGNIAYLPDVEKMKTDTVAAGIKMTPAHITNRENSIKQAKEYIESQGIQTVTVAGSWFEGGNILTDKPSKSVFMGMEPWATQDSMQKLITAINATQDTAFNIVGVPLVRYNNEDGNLYHIDLGMSEPLPNGKRFIYPGLTDPATYAKMREIIGGENLIEITLDDAMNKATNFEIIGQYAVATTNLPHIKSHMEESGLTVLSPDMVKMDGFDFGEGGVHCMTNQIPPSPNKSTSTKTGVTPKR